jgi:hypothetical protein
MKVDVAFFLFVFIACVCSMWGIVSGRRSRKTMIRTGGQAPNQNNGLHPWLVVFTKALANAVARR